MSNFNFSKKELSEMSHGDSNIDDYSLIFETERIDEGKYFTQSTYFKIKDVFYVLHYSGHGHYWSDYEMEYNQPEEVEISTIVRDYILLQGWANDMIFVNCMKDLTYHPEKYVEMHRKVKNALDIEYDEIPY